MERLRNCGGSLTIPCQGSLIVPSGNIDTLPLINEFILDPRRLTIAQSPLGGVNGLISYSPGSVHVTEGDGIYLTDVAGNNTSKYLPAGLLSRLGYLTVDTVAHSITQEFIVANTATSNNPSVIANCDSAINWSISYELTERGTIGVDSTDKVVGTGSISIVCTTAGTGALNARYSSAINLSSVDFLTVSLKGPAGKQTIIRVLSTPGNLSYGFTLSGNWDTYVLPVRNPQSITSSPDISSIYRIRFDLVAPAVGDSLKIDNLCTDLGKSVIVECLVPDYLSEESATIQCWTGAGYETTQMCELDSAFSLVSSTSTKMKFLNMVLFDSIYGVGNGLSLFPKGGPGDTVSASSKTITYSLNGGAKKRIGVSVLIPPYSSSSPTFSKCRLKLILSYSGIRSYTDGILHNPTPRTTLAIVAPYNTPTSYDSPSYQGTALECINTGHISRIRQTGLMKKVDFAVSNPSNITDFRIKIWRYADSTYTVVSVSDNLAALLQAGLNSITLSTAISAQVGDFYGVYIQTDNTVAVYQSDAVTGGIHKYLTASTNYSTGQSYNWSLPTASETGRQYTVKLYMTSPDIVFIGDSTIAGRGRNYSFIETSDVTNLYSQIEGYLGNGLTYQNMGIGGQNTDSIYSRFVQDLINLNPRYAVIECGLNEGDLIYDPTHQQQLLTQISSMIQQCNENGIISVICEIPPTTVDTLQQAMGKNTVVSGIYTLQNSLNFNIFKWRSIAGTLDAETGQWSIIPEYDDGDGLHFSIAGYRAVGRNLYLFLTNSTHMGQSTYDLSNDNNASTGLLNISKPWLAIIDPTTKNIDYYLFTERPTSFSYKRDESGNVYEVVVNPGNGIVYKGSTVWANNTLDTNTDSKPDMLDVTVQNSIAQMLSVYGFNR